MATETVYIDPVLGNDGTGAVDDPNLPFKHIQEGVNALTVGSDGIAMLAPGTYVEDSGGTNYCLLDRDLTSLTIAPSIDYSSVIKAAAVGSQVAVISAQSPLSVFSLGKVIIDAESTQTFHVIFDATLEIAAVIDGSRFVNCFFSVFGQVDYLTSFLLKNEWRTVDALRVLD